MANTKRNQRCRRGKKQVTKQQLDHEIDSATTSAHAPRWTHLTTRNYCPFTQLVTLRTTKSNLNTVGGRPLHGTKPRLSAKESHVSPTQSRCLVNTRTSLRKHFGRAGQETKQSTQNEPQHATPVTPRRDQRLARQQHGPRNGRAYRCLITHSGVRTSGTFESTREDGVAGVKLETTQNTIDTNNRRQANLDGRRPQMVAKAYATYLNNCHSLNIRSLQCWRKNDKPRGTRGSTQAPECP